MIDFIAKTSPGSFWRIRSQPDGLISIYHLDPARDWVCIKHNHGVEVVPAWAQDKCPFAEVAHMEYNLPFEDALLSALAKAQSENQHASQ